MGRVLSGLVLRHSKSKSAQVKTGKQCFSLTEHNRGKRKVQGVDQVCLQILPSHQTVKNILRRHGIAPAPKRIQVTPWKDFLAAHMNVLAGCDFFPV